MKKDYIDTHNLIIRKSAKFRVAFGVVTTVFVSTLYSYSMYKYRKYPASYFTNWIKGSLAISSSFYILNEVFVAGAKFHHFYSNYWMTMSLSAYIVYKRHFRTLIRRYNYNWYTAIIYSQKIILGFLCANLLIELSINALRYIYLFDKEDIIDLSLKFRESSTKQNQTDYNRKFKKGLYILNHENKVSLIQKQLRSQINNKLTDNNIVNINDICEEYYSIKKG